MNPSFIPLMANYGISRRRKLAALVFAWVIDGLRLLGAGALGFIAPSDDFADLFAAVVLVLLIGIRWQIVLGFAAELIPGVAAFPTWTALVAALPVEPTPGNDNPVIWPKGGEP